MDSRSSIIIVSKEEYNALTSYRRAYVDMQVEAGKWKIVDNEPGKVPA